MAEKYDAEINISYLVVQEGILGILLKLGS
jgi:hypothetical protein